MQIVKWISNNYIEIFGAVTGILYVFLEIRQNLWLWPVGIITSAVYIYVFFTGKLYADMSLQGYYLAISVIGWYWWSRGTGQRAGSGEPRANGGGPGAESREQEEEGRRGRKGDEETRSVATKYRETERGEGEMRGGGDEPVNADIKLKVTTLKPVTGIILAVVFLAIYAAIWMVLDRFTDSPVPAFDSFITSLSIVATWMLARKIYEHWFLWIIVNMGASILFFTRELYPTVILYIVYCMMSFAGLIEWRKSLINNE
jgi:nicotinamide mononucleotide transporter